MKNNRQSTARWPQIALDAVAFGNRRVERLRGIFDDTARCCMQSAMGNRAQKGGAVKHLSANLQDRVDLNRGTGWKAGDANRRAGVAARIAQHGDHQIRRAIDDQRLIGEGGR